jgi:exoribonuclease-2
LTCAEDGTLADIDIRPTLIRAERLTYAEAETRLGEPPSPPQRRRGARYRARRKANGAAGIDLPEVSVRVSTARS